MINIKELLDWAQAEERHPGCSAAFEWSGLADVPVTLRDTGSFDYQPMGRGKGQRLMACPVGQDVAFYGLAANYIGAAVYVDELELWIRCTASLETGPSSLSYVWPPRPRHDELEI